MIIETLRVFIEVPIYRMSIGGSGYTFLKLLSKLNLIFSRHKKQKVEIFFHKTLV